MSAMKKWSVSGVVTGSKWLGEFEAATKEEAEQLALEASGYVSLCHQCIRDCEDAEVTEACAEEIE